MRNKYIAGNWKMNMTPSKGAEFAKSLAKAVEENGVDVKVMISVPYVCIPAVKEAVKGSSIIVSSQNIANHTSGAYTGEVAPDMLLDLGVSTTLIGHSERREYYGDTDQIINSKVLLALKEGFDIVLCCGETLAERQGEKLEEVLTTQLTEGLKDVSAEDMAKITIAYEPVWAIGTGLTASPEDADDAHAFIRSLISKLYSNDIAKNTIIQYGGSVNASNVKALMAKENIDGALVGGASLSVDKFLPILTFNK